MRASPVLASLLAVSGFGGCVRVVDVTVTDFSAAEVLGVSVQVDRGEVIYERGTDDRVEVRVEQWGTGGGVPAAEARVEDQRLAVEVVDGTLVIQGDTTEARSGFDVVARGPEVMQLDLFTADGRVYAEDALGFHALEGDRVTTVRLQGEADVVAGARGADVELWPYEEGYTAIRSAGTVELRLPSYGPYDLYAEAAPGAEVSVVDLGFDELTLGDGWVEAFRVPGTHRIDVTVDLGGFFLEESF